MKTDIQKVADEILTHVAYLRRHHRDVPFVQVPRLDAMTHQLLRHLPDPAADAEKKQLGADLRRSITQLGGAYAACYATREKPSWLRGRHGTHDRVRDAAYWAACIAGLTQDTRLQAWLRIHGQLSLVSLRQTYARWSRLDRAQARQSPHLNKTVRGLLPFVRSARALMSAMQQV